MVGKLRQRRRGGDGVSADCPETGVLPLLEAACVHAGLPRAFTLGAELEASGYFRTTLMGQWNLAHQLLWERAREVSDPLVSLRRLALYPEPRVRFYAPGVLARVLEEHPQLVLGVLRGWAADENLWVAEAVQAFGIRPQLQRLGPDSVRLLADWVRDPSPFVRRAAIEAARPRGVWVKRLEWAQEMPAVLLPLLEPLRQESVQYVANAVGNALNDVSKDHPQLVLEVMHRWWPHHQEAPLLERICRKALRTLMKNGDPFAMRLLGFGQLDLRAKVKLLNGTVVRPNSTLIFELELHNRGASASAHLVYEIETVGRNPQRPRKHRFQAGSLQLPGKGRFKLQVQERIFDRRATPLLDGPGSCRFYLNGVEVAKVEFRLERLTDTSAKRLQKKRKTARTAKASTKKTSKKKRKKAQSEKSARRKAPAGKTTSRKKSSKKKIARKTVRRKKKSGSS